MVGTTPDRETARTAAAAAPLSVSIAVEGDRAAWDAFVAARDTTARGAAPEAEAATGYHEWAWRGVFTRAFAHTPVYLTARRGGAIEGVLPLVEIRSRLFGRSLTALPFVNYGGVVADTDEAARALVDAAGAEARARRSRHVEIRHIGRRFPDLPCRQHKVSMWLRLAPGLWDGFDRKVRNQVRKAEKSGLAAVTGGAELLAEFYAVFARNMRDLGTPVYSRRLFEEVLSAFPDRARITVVRLGARPVAAGVTYRSGLRVEIPWASSLREHNNLCPNHLLYWHALQAAQAGGAEIFDFGRSTPHEGTYKFKAQWGAVPVPLHWEYVLPAGGDPPDQSPRNPKFQAAIAAWQRCPLWLANALGPRIVGSIP